MKTVKLILIAVTVVGFATVPAASTVLVWDHDMNQAFTDPDDGDGSMGSEVNVRAALEANGVTVVTSTVLPTDLSPYEAVFVLCGWWPNDGALSQAELSRLEGYLNRLRARLYIEGGEIGNRYGNTLFYSLLGAEFADDGRPKEEGNMNEAQGIGWLEGLRYTYPGYKTEDCDNFIDEINADADGEVIMRSKRAGNQSNGRVVRIDAGPPYDYRAIYSTFPFGALKNGTHTRTQLMGRYVAFLGIGAGYQTGVAPASLGRVKAGFR
ncbi:MAG: hypothetical protein JSW52_11670 [Candidatus Coatesbacteria bacterium]|nr:MAG: hypothetical protein JSW52_11670 [Candidatus Coatesbacteria bacterium]